jgi:thiamine biosynthesis protein ThiI
MSRPQVIASGFRRLETTLVAYSEIALKSSSVRRRLERLLARQIESHLSMRGIHNNRARKRFGRIYVEGVTAEQAGIIAKIFGVASVMPAIRTEADLDSVMGLVVKIASDRILDGQSFAVRPRVVGDHPFSSQDLAVEAGSRVLDANSGRGVHVNLSEPDVTIYIEVRDKDAFVYTEIIKGVMGLPYGSQGRLVSLFSGGIDSPVATWLMMKRGAEVLPLLMDQRPYVGDSYVERAERACRAIGEYVPSKEFSLYEAPLGDVMSRIMKTPVPKLRCVLCKRTMYRIADIFGKEKDARGIVTGESLGQVASQTLDNLFVIDDASDLPVLRPNIGLDKVEIEGLARSIGTYDLTARKVEGCNVVPNRPSTQARLEQVLELEEELGLLGLCSEAAKGIQLIDVL